MSKAGGNCWEELCDDVRGPPEGAWPMLAMEAARWLALESAHSWSGSMVVLLAGGESKCQKYDNRKDGGAVDASEWIIKR